MREYAEVIASHLLLLMFHPNSFLGPPELRYWIWTRAGCAALSTVLFAIAAQTVPIMNLVVIVYLARE